MESVLADTEIIISRCDLRDTILFYQELKEIDTSYFVAESKGAQGYGYTEAEAIADLQSVLAELNNA